MFRTIIVDPERAPHIRWAFETYSEGNDTLKSLQLKLQERGLRSRATAKRVAKPMSVSGLQNMLRNPYYIGTIRWKDAEYDGAHEHLINQKLFDRVQTVLDSNRNGPSNAKSWKFKSPLKDYLRCGHCKHLMGFVHAKSSGNGRYYDYWYCLGHSTKAVANCPQRYVPADRVDEEVLKAWQEMEIDPASLDELKDLLDIGFEKAVAAHAQQTEAQRQTLVRLDREKKKLLQLFYDDTIDGEWFRAEQARIKKERTAATRALNTITDTRDELIAKLDEALALMRHSAATYEQSGYQGRRKLNSALVDAFFIFADGHVDAGLTELYTTLGRPNLVSNIKNEIKVLETHEQDNEDKTFDDLIQQLKNPDPETLDQGSRIPELVGLKGFEPLDGGSRTRG